MKGVFTWICGWLFPPFTINKFLKSDNTIFEKILFTRMLSLFEGIWYMFFINFAWLKLVDGPWKTFQIVRIWWKTILFPFSDLAWEHFSFLFSRALFVHPFSFKYGLGTFPSFLKSVFLQLTSPFLLPFPFLEASPFFYFLSFSVKQGG